MSSDPHALSEIAIVQGGYAFKSADFGDEGVAVVKIANIQPPLVSLHGADRVKPEKLVGLDRFALNDGDILMAMTGATVGKVGRFKRSEPAYLNQRVARISAKKGREFDDFIYAVLSLPGVDKLIEGSSAGSAQANISATGIGAFPVPRLSNGEQLLIGGFSRLIDDRITLLRETNATLEAISQAIFKSWFVDFDPVRAKMEGRAPEGMDEATAALFPDSFEESELGLVPKGWRVGTLGNILALRSERTKPSEETKMLPYVPIESISAKVPFLQEYKEGEEAKSSLTLFRKGDILFGAMRPYFHKVCIAPFDGVTRTTVFTLKPTNQEAIGFALFLAFQDVTVEYATQHSEGSTIPYAKWSRSLEHMPFILPPESLQIKFSEIVSAFIARANDNIEQAQTLAALRDTLLPRLISGKLRLPEAENTIAEAIA